MAERSKNGEPPSPYPFRQAHMRKRKVDTVKRIILAGALLAGLSASAYADGPPGQWMDTNNHIALGGLPEDSEPIARLKYAKADCRAKTGQVAGEMPTRADFACLKAEGFVWVYDSPAEIAARQRAADDAAARAAGYAVGQALINMGNGMNQPPAHCHPHTLQLGC